jgi:periplasmic protein TonB
MFEQALLESARHSPGARRTYSTAASLLLQAAALATFVAVPLLTTQIAPRIRDRAPMYLPQLTPSPVIESSGIQPVSTSSSASSLRQPRTINPLDRSKSDPDTQPLALREIGMGKAGPAMPNLFNNTRPQVVLRPADNVKPPVISVLEQGVVISRVQPLYPHIAIVNRIQGTVHLNAVIASNGRLEELRVLSGHPMLAQAALDAVRQWKFRPYVLNGQPIPVQTEVIVNFGLN